MKILHIINSSKCWGGVEQYINDLSEELIAKGHSVCFVINNDGDTVHPVYSRIGKVYLLKLRSKFDIVSNLKLRNIINSEQPDIIHTHQPKNIFNAWFSKLGRADRVKIVHTVHVCIKPTFPNGLYSFIFQKCDKIIMVSQTVSKCFFDIYANVDPHNVEMIHNSFRPKNQLNVEVNEGHESNLVSIGYAGRLIESKGVGLLLEAVDELNVEKVKFKFVVAGTGDQQYIDKLKSVKGSVDVEYLGFQKDMSKYYSSIDIAVMPSIATEGMSLVLMESMANGKAIITTDCGSQGELVQNRINALIVEQNDKQTLKEAIRELVANKKLRAKFADRAKHRFDRELNYDIFLRKVIEVYFQAKGC